MKKIEILKKFLIMAAWDGKKKDIMDGRI